MTNLSLMLVTTRSNLLLLIIEQWSAVPSGSEHLKQLKSKQKADSLATKDRKENTRCPQIPYLKTKLGGSATIESRLTGYTI
jgi:hypothetical protein